MSEEQAGVDYALSMLGLNFHDCTYLQQSDAASSVISIRVEQEPTQKQYI